MNVCESSRETSGNRVGRDGQESQLGDDADCGLPPLRCSSQPPTTLSRRAVPERTQPRREHDCTLALQDKPKQNSAKIRSPVHNTHTHTQSPEKNNFQYQSPSRLPAGGAHRLSHIRTHSPWAEATRLLTHSAGHKFKAKL